MMTNEPTISVVVPAYNAAPYIEECLRSIKNQSLQDFECIVVDDGSNDGTGTIVDSFASSDSRFRVIHQENRGLSAARNVGLDLAQGAFVGFVDADDMCLPEMYERLHMHIRSLDVPIVACGYSTFEDDSKRRGNRLLWDVGALEKVSSAVLNEYEIWEAHYAGDAGAIILSWNKLYRRELFQTLRFKERCTYEDNEIAIRLIPKAGCMGIVKESLYCYRVREDSLTKQNRPARYLDYCEALVARDAYFEEQGWDDIRDENALQLLHRVAHTNPGVEECGELTRKRFNSCRSTARSLAVRLLKRHWAEKRFLVRTIPFLIGESTYLKSSALYRSMASRHHASSA